MWISPGGRCILPVEFGEFRSFGLADIRAFGDNKHYFAHARIANCAGNVLLEHSQPAKEEMSAYFDGYAQRYGEVLQKSLNVTGENQEYFARRRVAITRDLLAERNTATSRIVDFGCGLGTAAPHLVEYLEPKGVVGVDVSREILKEAESRNKSARVSFAHVDDFSGEAELVFCNGVFHHIALAERSGALKFVRNILARRGYFAFWENNPLNPGTRYVMKQCEFDRDAVVITPYQARTMLKANGFQIIKATSAFFFPRSLAWMRGSERFLAPTMLGGQYLFLCRRG